MLRAAPTHRKWASRPTTGCRTELSLIPRQARARGPMPTLRVMTYNILFGGVGREQLIRDVVSAIRPDIAVFTEVTAGDSFDAIADAVGPYRAGRKNRTAREYPAIASRWPIMQSELH